MLSRQAQGAQTLACEIQKEGSPEPRVRLFPGTKVVSGVILDYEPAELSSNVTASLSVLLVFKEIPEAADSMEKS